MCRQQDKREFIIVVLQQHPKKDSHDIRGARREEDSQVTLKREVSRGPVFKVSLYQQLQCIRNEQKQQRKII